jgi:histone-lysine N-methyltransferase SETMAR
MLINGVVLHRDSAQPYTTAVTIETIQKLKFELIPHPEYGPYLTPSDYHIFRLLKDMLHGH